MNDLTKCLYDFVQDHRMGEIHGDPEYLEASHAEKWQLEKLCEMLSASQQAELRLLMDCISDRNSIECAHLFRITLRLSRELDRVGAE